MFNQLFINVLLLISVIFVGAHVIKELSEEQINSVYGKLILGISGGVLGITMINYTIHVVETHTLLDLRVLALMLISNIGGFLPTVISGLIMMAFRISYYGLDQSAIIALIQTILCIISFYIINRKIKVGWKNWLAMLLISALILVSTYSYSLYGVRCSYIIIIDFILVYIGMGALQYYLLSYAQRSNELYKKYKEDSTKDFLTGLNNTRHFDKLFNTSYYGAIERNDKLSCLIIDVDHFKRINDTFGHAAGDIVLKELAAILKKSCRSFDIIGRIGGEEFCVLLLDCSPERAFEISKRISNAIKEHKFFVEKTRSINITVSIGVATYPDSANSLEELRKKLIMLYI